MRTPPSRCIGHSPFAKHALPPRPLTPYETDRLTRVSGLDIGGMALLFFFGALAGYAIGRLNLLLPIFNAIDGGVR